MSSIGLGLPGGSLPGNCILSPPPSPPLAAAPLLPGPPPLQLDVRLAAHDARWHCRRTFQLALAGGAVELFSIDTTPLLLEYRGVPWNKNRGGWVGSQGSNAVPAWHVRQALLVCSAEAWAVPDHPAHLPCTPLHTLHPCMCRPPAAGGLLEQSWEGQLAELEGALAASTAAWKLVVGHHPIR